MSKYQEDEQFEKAIAIENDKDNGVKTHKTPIYQRNANKAYYERSKLDPEKLQARTERQKAYYIANRETILEKKRNKSPKAINNKKICENTPTIVNFD
jgi:hypothetical protein